VYNRVFNEFAEDYQLLGYTQETKDLLIFLDKQMKELISKLNPSLKQTAELKWKRIVIYENRAPSKSSNSYTINKETMFLCIRKVDNTIDDYNNILYVVIHEFSHMLSASIGHTDEFKEIFNTLLTTAQNNGLIRQVEQGSFKNSYCKGLLRVL
jgi:predicted metal-dependent hydrolase